MRPLPAASPTTLGDGRPFDPRERPFRVLSGFPGAGFSRIPSLQPFPFSFALPTARALRARSGNSEPSGERLLRTAPRRAVCPLRTAPRRAVCPLRTAPCWGHAELVPSSYRTPTRNAPNLHQKYASDTAPVVCYAPFRDSVWVPSAPEKQRSPLRMLDGSCWPRACEGGSRIGEVAGQVGYSVSAGVHQ